MSAHSDPSPYAAYSINETASLLGISRRLVYDLLSKGKLKSVRVGARQRIPVSELEQLVKGRTQPAAVDTESPTGEGRPDDAAVAPSEKPQAPREQPVRVNLSELLAQVGEPSAGR